MTQPILVGAPLAGRVLPLTQVPDPVFAEAMLGEGLAIDPIEGLVRAPLSGRVAVLHPAGHAVTLETDAGPVLLIHIGLETVALGGEGFDPLVREGDCVAAGDPLIRFDLDAVGRKAASLVTPVVLTNGEAFSLRPLLTPPMRSAGEPLFELFAVAGKTAKAEEIEPAIERAIVVPLRHGIHARPAARLAECLRGYDARATLVAADGRSASMASPVAVLALALRHGAHATLRASGAQAHAALDALASLIDSGMGEGAPLTDGREGAPPVETPLPPILHGVRAAPGIAIGPAWRLPDLAAALPETGGDPVDETKALAAALTAARTELACNGSGEGPGAAIALAQLALLDDESLREVAEDAIAAGASAGKAWQQATRRFAELLAASGDARFAERVDDMRDIERQVLAQLTGDTAALDPPAGAVLAAADVLPSQLLALADKGLAGIAAGGGGPTGHAAIIAASLGLPMVAALGPNVERIAPGTTVLLDAGTASLAISPSEAMLAERREARARKEAARAAAEICAHEPAITRDGTVIEVFANLGSRADADAAVRAGAEGCGLLRTEFAFLDRADAPGEDEQAALYIAIAEALGPRPLIARTLDIGADKPAPWLALTPEENPALGLRGLRIGLARPEILRTQLRALMRAVGDIRIMLPMVVEPGELAEARAMLLEEATRMGCQPPPLGVMVETPSAALLASALAEQADFFSIGTNDLSQYTLAKDRGNPALAASLDALHPAVLRLIAATIDGARGRDRWVGVCGGLAADPDAVPILLGLGVTELSVPVAQIALTKAAVRACELAACRDLAARALQCSGTADVRALVRQTQTEEVPA